MGSEKNEFQTPLRPPQEVSRRPRTRQGLEVGPNLGPKKGPRKGSKSIKIQLGRLQVGRPFQGYPKGTPELIFNRFFNDFD